jgi:chemotaxis protein MotB
VPRKQHHEEHENTEAWAIPYADMLTLLMVMFLALYAMGNIDLQKFKALAQAFNREMGGGAPTRVVDPGVLDAVGASSILDGAGAWPIGSVIGQLTNRGGRAEATAALNREREAAAAAEAGRRELEMVERTITERLASEAPELAAQVQTRRDERGLTITMLSDGVVFAPGSAELQGGGRALIEQLAPVLDSTGNVIEVVGHTDSRPVSGGPYPSNWELSTARAGSVARYLIEQLGLPPNRVRTSGVADTQPIASNETAEGRSRNRRVEITVLAGSPTATVIEPASGNAQGGA